MTSLLGRSVKDFSPLPGVHWILQVTSILSVVSEFDIIISCPVDMAGFEGLEEQKVDNVQTRGSVGLPCWCAGFEAASRILSAPQAIHHS